MELAKNTKLCLLADNEIVKEITAKNPRPQSYTDLRQQFGSLLYDIKPSALARIQKKKASAPSSQNPEDLPGRLLGRLKRTVPDLVKEVNEVISSFTESNGARNISASTAGTALVRTLAASSFRLATNAPVPKSGVNMDQKRFILASTYESYHQRFHFPRIYTKTSYAAQIRSNIRYILNTAATQVQGTGKIVYQFANRLHVPKEKYKDQPIYSEGDTIPYLDQTATAIFDTIKKKEEQRKKQAADKAKLQKLYNFLRSFDGFNYRDDDDGEEDGDVYMDPTCHALCLMLLEVAGQNIVRRGEDKRKDLGPDYFRKMIEGEYNGDDDDEDEGYRLNKHPVGDDWYRFESGYMIPVSSSYHLVDRGPIPPYNRKR